MSFRDAIKKGGGGFLTGDGTQVSYEFSDKFHGEKKSGQWVYFVPTILMDGASEPVTQHMFLGGADTFEISEDGLDLTMADGESVTFGGDTPFGRYVDTATEKDTDELFVGELPDLAAGEPMNLTALDGQRFRFAQEVDVKGTAKRGQRMVKNKKTGKTTGYDRTNTVIAAVLGTAAKGGKVAAGKGKGKKNDEDAVNTDAVDVLTDVLDSSKTPITEKNISLPVTKALLQRKDLDKDEKEARKALILDSDWREANGFESDKKGVISKSE